MRVSNNFLMRFFRIVLCCFWVFASIVVLSAQYINEFHYNNDGTDVGEFIEVVIPGSQPDDLSHYKLYLYNGNNGNVYGDLKTLADHTGQPMTAGGVTYYIVDYPENGIQNGNPDGIALVHDDGNSVNVVEFISYGGSSGFTATDGPANGQSSTHIGVAESASTPIGWSLQKRSDGTWFAGPSTRGAVNPIELLSFEGKYFEDAEGVVLTWRTASELNNHFFEVQRSDDQRSFYALTEVEGAGHSQELQSYTYVDQNIDQPQIYYRLKQVDYDGSFAYSPVITVTVDGPERAALAHINPVLHNNQEIYLPRSDYRHPVDLMIYDGLGRQLFYQKQMKQGDCTPFRYASSGILFYRIQSRGQTHAGRLVALDH